MDIKKKITAKSVLQLAGATFIAAGISIASTSPSRLYSFIEYLPALLVALGWILYATTIYKLNFPDTLICLILSISAHFGYTFWVHGANLIDSALLFTTLLAFAILAKRKSKPSLPKHGPRALASDTLFFLTILLLTTTNSARASDREIPQGILEKSMNILSVDTISSSNASYNFDEYYIYCTLCFIWLSSRYTHSTDRKIDAEASLIAALLMILAPAILVLLRDCTLLTRFRLNVIITPFVCVCAASLTVIFHQATEK